MIANVIPALVCQGECLGRSDSWQQGPLVGCKRLTLERHHPPSSQEQEPNARLEA